MKLVSTTSVDPPVLHPHQQPMESVFPLSPKPQRFEPLLAVEASSVQILRHETGRHLFPFWRNVPNWSAT